MPAAYGVAVEVSKEKEGSASVQTPWNMEAAKL